MSLLVIITSCGALVGLLIGLLTIWEKVIKPRLRRTRFIIAVNLINEWFDYIDCNLEKGIDFPILENKDKKVTGYIASNLTYYKIKPTKRVRREWLKNMGIKKSLRSSKDLFTTYSRMSSDGDYLSLFFTQIVANFYNFHSLYKSKNPTGCNYAEVEMPVKFLNFLIK